MSEDNQSVTTKTENTAMTIGDRLAASGVEAKDLVPSRLLLMQNTSEDVGEGLAKLGDILHSTNREVVGGVDAPIEIIPLSLYKTLLTEDMSTKQAKFLKQEPLTAENEKLPREGTDLDAEGKRIPVKRSTCFNFFVLLASEVASDDAFPLIVRFKSSGMSAGKQLATHMFKRAALGQEAYSQTVLLGVKKEKKDTNTYAVYTITKGRKSTEAETEMARVWLKPIEQMRPRVNHFTDAADPTVASVTPTVADSSPEDAEKF